VGLTYPHIFRAAVEYSIIILRQVLPIIAVVFVLIFLLNLVLKPEMVKRALGTEAGLRGWAIAIVGGILSAGPIYVWYPLLSDLRKKGMRPAFMAAFLYNRAIKLPVLPVMIFYFGWAFAAVLSLYMAIASLAVGLATEWFTARDEEHKK
jgi:uncharacterized membrane protein YraQ (UPF0718 family)